MLKHLLIACLTIPAIASAQFLENFDGSNSLPARWTVLNGGDANTWQIVNYTGGTIAANSGTNTASIGYSAAAHDDYLVTPPVTVTAGASDFLTFWARSRDPLYAETISVKVSTTNPTAGAFTKTLAETVAPASGANFYKYSYDLSEYVGQTIYIAFYSSTTDKFYFDVDDVKVGAAETCDSPPTVAVSTVTSNSATVNWTPSSISGATYQIEYGPSGFTPGAGTAVTSNTATVTLSNLSAGTAYQVYVRANCGNSIFSAWSPVTSFTTGCAATTSFPYIQNFDTATIPSCWRNEAVTGGGTAVWNYVTANGNSSIVPKSAPTMAEFRTATAGNKGKLVMPPMDISALETPELQFSFANVNWSGHVDELRIYYKAKTQNAWTQIGSSYTTEHTAWTDVTIPLPEKSSYYQIAFEGTYNWARGINVDNVSVANANTLGVSVGTHKNNVKIYPNPANDVVNIAADIAVHSIEIYSMTGKLIKTFSKDTKQINVSDLSSGIYLLRIKSEGADQSFKLIKE